MGYVSHRTIYVALFDEHYQCTREWGMAAMYAHRAYKEQTFLNTAMSIWEVTSVFSITQEENDAGRHSLKNGTFGCHNGEH